MKLKCHIYDMYVAGMAGIIQEAYWPLNMYVANIFKSLKILRSKTMQCLVSQPTVALSPSILSCTSDSSLAQKLYKLLRGLFSLKGSVSIIRQAPCSVWWVSPLWFWALQFLLCKPDSSANLGTEALQITVNYVPSIFQIREIEFSPFLHFPPLQPPPLPLVACSVQSKGQHFNYQASTTS